MSVRNINIKDESSKETQVALKTAFLEFYAVSPLQRISINRICERAGVSRGSFYYHYANIYELLDDIENEIICGINSCIRKNSLFDRIIQRANGGTFETAVSEYVLFLDYLEQNRKSIATLYLGSDSHFFRDKLLQTTTDNFMTAFQFLPPCDVARQKYIVAYTASGTISTYMKWLIDGMLEPKETIAEVLMNNANKIFSTPK